MDSHSTKTLDKQMFHAIVSHDEDLLRALLKSGAHPDKPRHFGRTCLTQASTIGTDATVRLLIEQGADPNLMDDEGDTALDCAVWEDRAETAQILLSLGADPEKTQGGIEYLLKVIEDRAPDCGDVLAVFLSIKESQVMEANTIPSLKSRPKQRI